MKQRRVTWLAGFGVLFIGGLLTLPAFGNSSTVEIGRILAILLDSGRGVVGANQPLINDASKGDKGFTPDVFEKQLGEKFKARSGQDLGKLQGLPPEGVKLVGELVAASKATVAKNQDNINKAGVAFKAFTPAHFGTQAAKEFSSKSGIYMKQTTTDALLRNPDNKADDFEKTVLTKFTDPSFSKGDKVFSEVVDGGKSVRVLLPLFYSKGCLGCHGEPKGETDISGYKKEGAKEGDLGGAISVKLPMK